MEASKAIAAQISDVTGRVFVPNTIRPLGGGCIHAAWEFSDGAESYFVKSNAAQQLDGFAVEAAGLRLIAETKTVRVPNPLCWGAEDDSAWLVLEFLRLGRGDSGASLGEKLASMHHCLGAQFGLDHDNVIGSTPQINQASDNWIEFWRTHRLGYQLRLAAGNGHRVPLEGLGQSLLEVLPEFFVGYRPSPSLLHGDLWSGNAATQESGESVVMDPAVYYGDRETDIAMTELFGGFSPRFYEAYRANWALDPGYGVRKTLYNLYHVLNHLNLFGSGYLSQAERMHRMLLAEARG